ncbi:MAG: aldo/keto reductase, partial [Caldilineaceae bacterium]|nr:aldo/keto reductase [Caldilineaceae bacterium]
GRPGYINLGHADDLNQTYDVTTMETHAHQVLDAAWAGGVRYFDVARSYGRAEEFLGSWLHSRAMAVDAVSVGSKWGYTYTADWHVEATAHEVKEHSLERFQYQFPETLYYLGEYLRLYQIHSVTLESGVLSNQAVLSALATLRAEQGVAIGLSLSGPAQRETLFQALAIERDGVRLFDSVQATWNLLERSAGDGLAQAHAAGMKVIVKEALANGRLTSRNRDPGFIQPLALLQQEATRLQTTVDALALATVLQNAWADVVLSGAATVEQLQSNLAAVAVPLDKEAQTTLATLAEAPPVYWKTRSNLQWN